MDQDPEGKSERLFKRRWMSFFGVKPDVVATSWNLLEISNNDPDDTAMNGAKPEHLLWALMFLKKYGNETEMARLVGVRATSS